MSFHSQGEISHGQVSDYPGIMRNLRIEGPHFPAHFPDIVVNQIPSMFLFFQLIKRDFVSKGVLIPLTWSALQDYCLPLASPLHVGNTQSLQTPQQSAPSASAKAVSGRWRKWRGKQQTQPKEACNSMSDFFPQSQEKDRSGGHDQPRMPTKWALLWNDPAGFQMKTTGKSDRRMFSCLLPIKTRKIKLNQCGKCQRTHPPVNSSSSNNVRCKNPSIVPIPFELLFCIALLDIQERRSGTGYCEINMNLKWLYCETQNF